jgi:hypothetical protein
MKDLTQIERGKTISFFNELDTETRTMLVTFVSFFNEVSTETQKNYPRKWFHFLMSLKSEKLCSKTSVSFFNEVASETQKLSSELFLIMDSKRTMLWNDTMSRDKTRSWLPRGLHWKEETHSGRTPCRGFTTGVKRSDSNNPIEEITMSTTGSKSSEVEAMGDNAT